MGIGLGWMWLAPRASGKPPGAVCEFHQKLQPESNLKPVTLAWSFCNDWAAAIQRQSVGVQLLTLLKI